MSAQNILLCNLTLRGCDALGFDLCNKSDHFGNVTRHRQEHQNVLVDILDAPILTIVKLLDQLDHDLGFLATEVQPFPQVIHVSERLFFLQLLSHICKAVLVHLVRVWSIRTDALCQSQLVLESLNSMGLFIILFYKVLFELFFYSFEVLFHFFKRRTFVMIMSQHLRDHFLPFRT